MLAKRRDALLVCLAMHKEIPCQWDHGINTSAHTGFYAVKAHLQGFLYVLEDSMSVIGRGFHVYSVSIAFL